MPYRLNIHTTEVSKMVYRIVFSFLLFVTNLVFAIVNYGHGVAIINGFAAGVMFMSLIDSVDEYINR